MIGYIFLSASLLSGLIKGFFGKKASNITRDVNDGIDITLIRMIFCTLIGVVVILCSGGQIKLVSGFTLFISIISAAVMSIFAVSWLLAVKSESYMFISIATMLGSMCVAVVSSILFQEALRIGQVIGMIMLVVSVVLMHGYNTTLKGRMKLSQLIMLIICGISSGGTDLTQKCYMKVVGTDAQLFNLYTYFFCIIILLVIYPFIHNRNTEHTTHVPFKKVFLYVLIMSVCLYANSLFKTLAAGVLPAATLFPMLQGSSLVLSSAMVWIFFGERITKKGFFGITVALIAMIIINI